jgi:hypothetical protein
VPAGDGFTAVGGLAGCGLVVSQPASENSTQSNHTRSARSWSRDGDSLECGYTPELQYRPDAAMEGLLLLLLEAGIALAILVFIVWWTWPRRGRGDRRDGPPSK